MACAQCSALRKSAATPPGLVTPKNAATARPPAVHQTALRQTHKPVERLRLARGAPAPPQRRAPLLERKAEASNSRTATALEAVLRVLPRPNRRPAFDRPIPSRVALRSTPIGGSARTPMRPAAPPVFAAEFAPIIRVAREPAAVQPIPLKPTTRDSAIALHPDSFAGLALSTSLGANASTRTSASPPEVELEP